MAGFELTRSNGNHGSATLNWVVFFSARFESTQCLGRFRQVFNVYNPCSRDAPCGVPLLRVALAPNIVTNICETACGILCSTALRRLL